MTTVSKTIVRLHRTVTIHEIAEIVVDVPTTEPNVVFRAIAKVTDADWFRNEDKPPVQHIVNVEDTRDITPFEYEPTPENVEMNAVSPSGHRIIGTLDSVLGTARITPGTFRREADGSIGYADDGETEMDWGAAETLTRKGQTVFIDSNGGQWLERELILEPVA